MFHLCPRCSTSPPNNSRFIMSSLTPWGFLLLSSFFQIISASLPLASMLKCFMVSSYNPFSSQFDLSFSNPFFSFPLSWHCSHLDAANKVWKGLSDYMYQCKFWYYCWSVIVQNPPPRKTLIICSHLVKWEDEAAIWYRRQISLLHGPAYHRHGLSFCKIWQQTSH